MGGALIQYSRVHSTADGCFIDCGSVLDVQFSGHFPESSRFLAYLDGDAAFGLLTIQRWFSICLSSSAVCHSRASFCKFTTAALPFVCLMANTACVHFTKKNLVVNFPPPPLFDDKPLFAVFLLTKLFPRSWGLKSSRRPCKPSPHGCCNVF